MADPFDIFEVDIKDAVRWLGAAATLAEAQATIRRQGLDISARYIVVDQKTGQKISVDRAGLTSKLRVEARLAGENLRRAARA
jgi:hypothetical protein